MISAQAHLATHHGLRTSNTYNQRIVAVSSAIRKEHYKKERVEQLKQVATAKGNINKKENQLQQKTGVDITLDMLGFIAYGKLKKATHNGAIVEELVHRGVCTLEEANALNITECKRRLKIHEMQRLQNSADKAFANKGFQPQSQAQFVMS